MCGNPPVKHSVAQKHGVSMETVLGKFPGEENHPKSLYEEGTYKLHRDFALKVRKFKGDGFSEIDYEVEEIGTLLNGKCYKITTSHALRGNISLHQIKCVLHI